MLILAAIPVDHDYYVRATKPPPTDPEEVRLARLDFYMYSRSLGSVNRSYSWRPNNMAKGGLHYHDDFFGGFPRMALRLNSFAELEEEFVAIQQPGYRAALDHKFLKFHRSVYDGRFLHPEIWLKALTTISGDRSVLESASRRDDEGLANILVVDVVECDRINNNVYGCCTLVVSIQNERSWAQDYYDVPSPELNTYQIPQLEGYSGPTRIGADRDREAPDLTIPSGLRYYNAFFEDFPLRPIWCDNELELDDELYKFNQNLYYSYGKKVNYHGHFDQEYEQIIRSTYHLQLLSIFDLYHPEVDPDGSTEADKHLETWIRTLHQVDLDRDRFRAYNDHGVWTGGYSIKPIERGNQPLPKMQIRYPPRITNASISPEDPQDLRTYQLQVPTLLQDKLYGQGRAPLGGSDQGFRHTFSLKVPQGDAMPSLSAISTNGTGKRYNKEGATYGLLYDDAFFKDFPYRSLTVTCPPVGAKSIAFVGQIVARPQEDNWNQFPGPLAEEFNKLGNPRYRTVLLKMFEKFHEQDEAWKHLSEWISTMRDAYLKPFALDGFLEANAPSFDDRPFRDSYTIRTTKYRHLSEPKNKQDSIKYQIPSSQSEQALAATLKLLGLPPGPQGGSQPQQLQTNLQAFQVTDQNTMSSQGIDCIDWALAKPDGPDSDLDTISRPDSSMHLLKIDSRIREKVLMMVVCSDQPIKPFLCESSVGKDYTPVLRPDCPCRDCSDEAPWKIIGEVEGRISERTPRSALAVAWTCRQMHKEAIPLYYAHNIFQFYVGRRNAQRLGEIHQDWFKAIGENVNFIRHIVWMDTNNTATFEAALKRHTFKEFANVTTIKFVTQGVVKNKDCRLRRELAHEMDVAKPLVDLTRFIKIRRILRQYCREITITFPKHAINCGRRKDGQDACADCQYNQKFYEHAEKWFLEMKNSQEPQKFELHHRNDRELRAMVKNVSNMDHWYHTNNKLTADDIRRQKETANIIIPSGMTIAQLERVTKFD